MTTYRGKAARVVTWPAPLACGLAGVAVLLAAGCGSSSPPSWASALGSGVTITAPASVSPGTGSPGAVIQGLFTAIGAKKFAQECQYIEPSMQSDCKSGASQVTASDAPYFKNAAIGYVATDGDRALVGTTGTFCVPQQTPECYTNNDPAAIFSTNKDAFGTLWTAQVKASTQNVYSLAPCIEIGGHWYLYESSS